MKLFITRRFWLTAGHHGPAATIDVRTNKSISLAQAQANAESHFEQKTKHKPVFCQNIKVSATKPNYTIGPES